MKHFVKKFGRYPTRIEELENTNQIRFLRRRYKDPITGKDFKILHMGDVQMAGGAGIAGATAAKRSQSGRSGSSGGPGGQAGIAERRHNTMAIAGGLAAGTIPGNSAPAPGVGTTTASSGLRTEFG